MGLKVAYMSDEAIEKDAQAMLADYARARGTPIEAPIPIDDIIEKHLKIGIEFDDTHRLFGVPRSGIEAASAAWHPLGWMCVGVAEIEKFSSAVLKRHQKRKHHHECA